MVKKNTTSSGKNQAESNLFLKVDGLVIRINFKVVLVTAVLILFGKTILNM